MVSLDHMHNDQHGNDAESREYRSCPMV